MMQPLHRLRQYLAAQPQWITVVFAALTTFLVYTCMYGYRKAFAAAGYTGQAFAGVDLKVWLVTAQVIGYMLSKFYGIKFIAEHVGQGRGKIIFTLITLSWLALLGFALVPAPWGIVFLLLNGFPLGMIWGLVFSFVEGRKATEFMGAVLASSFIFASGFAKSIGAWLMQTMQVPEVWMPFAAGAIYFLPMALTTWLLEAIPPPSEKDIAQRSKRLPMNRQERLTFLSTFASGIVVLIVSYILLTILRDFRDNFANEILTEQGLTGAAAIFTQTETPVALMVLAAVSLLALIKNNYQAFYLNHLIIMLGWLIALVATLLFQAAALSAFGWFLLTGTGLYLAYIPINCLYFDRLIATFRMTANVGFLMYVADAFGYLGSVLVLFVKQFMSLQLSWSAFFANMVVGMSAISLLCVGYSMWYYHGKHRYYKAHAALPEGSGWGKKIKQRTGATENKAL